MHFTALALKVTSSELYVVRVFEGKYNNRNQDVDIVCFILREYIATLARVEA